MTEKDIKKKIVFVIILMIALGVGYIYSKPYLPMISDKYEEIVSSLTNDSNKKKKEKNKEETLETTIINNEIDAQKLISLQTEGNNGEGTINYSINEEELQALTFLDEEAKNNLKDSLKVEINPKDNLSNNDEVSVDVSYTVPDNSKFTIINNKFNYKISDLSDVETFSLDTLKDSIEVDFTGYNGKGKANIKTNFEEPFDKLTVRESTPNSDYSNGDEMTIVLTDNSKKILEKMGYKVSNTDKLTYKVADLEMPITVTNDIINKHVVVSFMGTSGVGSARLDTTFQPPFSDYLDADSFEIENNGKIRNDEEVSIKIKDNIKTDMENHGFDFKDDVIIKNTASNLPEVSENIKNTKNWKELVQKISDQIAHKYPDTLFGTFEITLERYYYRPFHVPNDLVKLENTTQDGTFIAVYTVKTYSKDKKELNKTETIIFGYTNLYINSKNEVKLKEAIEYSHKFDNSYSLDSVYKIIEGYDFKAINLKD